MKRHLLRRRGGFTLVEILTVIVIIAILAALTLAAFSGVMKSAARSRARAEITAISSVMETYKDDNGGYPTVTAGGFSDTNYASDGSPATAGSLYQDSSAALYEALTGQKNFGDPPPTTTRIYFQFKRSQLGNNSAANQTQPIYIQDPFGYSYGYFPGSGANIPISGTNQFDFWTTGGDVTGMTNSWISNWGLGS